MPCTDLGNWLLQLYELFLVIVGNVLFGVKSTFDHYLVKCFTKTLKRDIVLQERKRSLIIFYFTQMSVAVPHSVVTCSDVVWSIKMPFNQVSNRAPAFPWEISVLMKACNGIPCVLMIA